MPSLDLHWRLGAVRRLPGGLILDSHPHPPSIATFSCVENDWATLIRPEASTLQLTMSEVLCHGKMQTEPAYGNAPKEAGWSVSSIAHIAVGCL